MYDEDNKGGGNLAQWVRRFFKEVEERQRIWKKLKGIVAEISIARKEHV